MRPIELALPPDMRAAVEAEASAAGMSLSEWIRGAIARRLPRDVRATLTPARRPGRPAKVRES